MLTGQTHRASTELSISFITFFPVFRIDTKLLWCSQFARNPAIYQSGAIPIPSYSLDGRQASLLEYLLRESEQLFGRIRRYTSPDEHAFFPQALPPLILPPLTYPKVRPTVPAHLPYWCCCPGANCVTKLMQELMLEPRGAGLTLVQWHCHQALLILRILQKMYV